MNDQIKKSLLMKWWLRVTPPRRHRVILSLRYCVYIVVGLITVISPTGFLLTEIGETASRAWGWLLMVGGGVGAIFVYMHELVWERAALLILAGCLFLYMYAQINVGIFAEGEPRWISIGLIILAGLGIIDRYVEIYKFDIEPGH